MKIGIIWAWASGMAIASFIAEQNLDSCEVHIIEKNNCFGKKVAITGWWRCNLTNALKNRKEYLSKYIRGSNLVEKIFEIFWPKKTYSRFENNWLQMKTEDNYRVFPVSDKSSDVIRIFEKNIAKNWNIITHFLEKVEWVKYLENKFEVKTNKSTYIFDCLVVATWWNAYIATGSSWDWYNIARQLGHTVTQLSPSLSSLEIDEKFCSNISWLTFDNAGIIFDNKKISWWLVFTMSGISGPLVFALSAYLAHTIIDRNNTYKIKFIPNIEKTYEYYDKQIQDLIRENSTKQMKNILWELLPKRFITEILPNYSIDIEKTWATFAKEERKKVCHLLSWWLELTLNWRKIGEEFVTAWWVDLSEINYKTLESKLVKNLYFSWEILDIDAVTWWFNLQFCWSGAKVIAEDIKKKCI